MGPCNTLCFLFKLPSMNQVSIKIFQINLTINYNVRVFKTAKNINYFVILFLTWKLLKFFSRDLLVFHHECCSPIGYATHYLFCCR